MNASYIKHACRGALATLVAGAAIVPATPVHADFSFTLTQSTSQMTYGGASPTFRATLTLPSDDPPLSGNNYPVLMVGSTGYASSVTGGGGAPYSLYWSGFDATALGPGTHSIYAVYQSPNHGAMQSNAVTLTVVKSTPNVQCGLTTSAAAYTYARGATYSVQVGTEWAGDPFTITFAGLHSYAMGPIAASSSGTVVTSVPSITGVYQTTCTFDGTATLNSASQSMGQTVVSLDEQPGGIAFYASPTPIAPNTPTTWRVVISARPGSPTPTGGVGLRIGSSYTRGGLTLSGGAVTFSATAPAFSSSDQVQVAYYGDTVYSSAISYFSLNPPPIQAGTGSTRPSAPASNSTTSQGGESASSAPSPAASQSPASSPSAVASSTIRIEHSVAAAVTSSAGGRGVWLVGIAAVLILLGPLALLAWRRRRAMGR